MSATPTVSARAVIAALLSTTGLAVSARAQVVPINAVTMEQISYPPDINGLGANSLVGSFTIRHPELSAAFPGPLGGFINVAYLPGGIQDPGQAVWLVFNLPVFGPGLDAILPGASNYDHNSITTQFNLSPLPGAVLGQALASAQNVAVVYTPGVQENLNWVLAPGALARNFNVSPLTKSMGGTGDNLGITGHQPPPAVGPIVAGGFMTPLYVLYIQSTHENVQSAHMQCAPMATANSFKYLKDALGLVLQNGHDIGLGGIAPNYVSDGTLVGTLDSLMKRFNAQGTVLQGRRSGKGMWPMQGAMAYLTRNDLAHQVYISHRIGGGVFSISGDPYTGGQANLVGNADYTSPDTGMVSVGKGNDYSASWLIEELDDHAGIMLDYGPSQHYVSVIGAGYMARRSFVLHVSDSNQSNTDQAPDDMRGCDRVDFDYVDEATKMLLQTKKPVDQIVSFQKVTQRALPIRCYAGAQVAIPDGTGNGTCGVAAAAEVTIQNSFKVGLVRPSFHITHPYQGDIKVTLRKVGGPSVVLTNRPGVNAAAVFGFSADHFGASANVRFYSVNIAPSLYHTPPIAAPGINSVAGDWKPVDTLAAFVGQDSAGTWRLEVQDCAENDLGHLVEFCLELWSLSGASVIPNNCYANCDGSTGTPALTPNDFQCFINAYAAGSSAANCDGSSGNPVLTANDFICFLGAYAAGCS